VARFRDHLGSQVEVAAPWYLAAAGISIPKRLLAAVQTGAASATKAARTKSRTRRSEKPAALVTEAPAVPPLWVLREGTVLGVVKFARSGEAEGAQVVSAVRAQNPRAQFVYVSRHQEADALALGARLDFQRSVGGLNPAAKLDLLRGLSGKVLWIGDGSRPEARELVAASAVSASVGSIFDVRDDAADILLLQRGLAGLADVIEVGRGHGRRLADDYRAVYTVNLLGLLGAFLARFTSLHAGLLSHAGAGLIYARHARGLDKLAAVAEARRAALLQLTAG
jgi:cation transport ATPase